MTALAAALLLGMGQVPSPQRRLGPQGVKSAEFFTRWDPGLRRDDGEVGR